MLKGRPVSGADALAQARALLAASKRPVALVSNAASNEELEAFATHLGPRLTSWVKTDCEALPGEVVADAFLIRADKNPNSAGALSRFAPLPADAAQAFPADCDLVFVWGEGCRFTQLPRGARIVHLNSWLQPENGHADVFIPVSTMFERSGSYTNAQGGSGRFEACFAKPEGVIDAASFFADWVAA
jgi:NADH-quinone oxidoreductase subunit G